MRPLPLTDDDDLRRRRWRASLSRKIGPRLPDDHGHADDVGRAARAEPDRASTLVLQR